MPTTRVEVAWAVPINIEQLGPHLEAYSSLQPVSNTLRLCNRFGTGPKAAITKIPIELIHQIERCLLRDKQKKLVPAWKRDLRCWQNSCEPIDHKKNSDILELYNDLHEQHSECGEGCDLFSTKPAVKVTKRVRQCLTKFFSEVGDIEWRDEHDERIAAWHRRVGSPTATSRGRFDEFSNVLTKHFGLQTWVSHVQESRDMGHMDETVAHTTKAYIRLPQVASVTHDFDLHVIDCEWSPRRQPTEAGFASELSIPQPVSTKEARRFTRALKVLELAGPAKPKRAGSMQGNKSMPSGPESSDTKGASVDAEFKPKLTLLIRNDDDEEY